MLLKEKKEGGHNHIKLINGLELQGFCHENEQNMVSREEWPLEEFIYIAPWMCSLGLRKTGLVLVEGKSSLRMVLCQMFHCKDKCVVT